MKKKILFICYNYKKTSLAGTIQNRRLITLLKTEYDVSIIFRDRNSIEEKDELGVASMDCSFIDRVLYKLFPFYNPIFGLNSWIWCRKVYRRIESIINRYDCVIFPFEPYSINPLIKKLLNKKTSAKIIALMYDPLSKNLFFNQSALGFWLRSRLEKAILKADAIVVNNTKEYEYLHNKYCGSKICCIPLLPGAINEVIASNSIGRTSVVHAGSIHGDRNLIIVNKAISILRKSEKDLANKLVLYLYGRCNDKDIMLVCTDKNDDIIKFNGYKDNSIVTERLVEADALLLIDPIKEGNYSFPSKLADYALFKKPIICIAAADSPSSLLLHEYEYPTFSDKNVGELADYIKELINGNLALSSRQKEISMLFNSNNILNKYIELINTIC